MRDDCEGQIPPELLEGIEQFNRGEYYECHETLEDLWRSEHGSIRNLYKGILQIGVAIYHAKRSNFNGARRLIESGTELLAPFSPHCLGVDVQFLIQSAERLKEELIAAAPGQGLSAPVIHFVRFQEDRHA